jgi:hypothetical protein
MNENERDTAAIEDLCYPKIVCAGYGWTHTLTLLLKE